MRSLQKWSCRNCGGLRPHRLPLKPSFAPVTYEEACDSLPPVTFSRWLYISPNLLNRSRWGRLRWVRGLSYRKLPQVDGLTRQLLRTLAIREQDYAIALQRLRTSLPHERSLNEKLASLHRGEYIIEKCLLPLRLMIREMEVIAKYLLNAPPHILHPIIELRGEIVSTALDLNNLVRSFSRLLTATLQRVIGAKTATFAAILHRVDMPLHRVLDDYRTMGRTLRRNLKHAIHTNGSPQTTRQRQHASYKSYSATVRESLSYNAITFHKDSQKVRALDNDPARWVSVSFDAHFENIIGRRWFGLCNQVYEATRFDNFAREWTSELSKRAYGLRDQAFRRFRRTLDDSHFKLPTPYGQNGNQGKDLFTLARELKWIRDYRIERFPDSVSQEEIRLARDFYFDMSLRYKIRKYS